jgi:hypothetical protein
MIMFEGFCVLGQCWTLASRRSKFEFELMARWVPEETEAACSVVKDASTPTAVMARQFLAIPASSATVERVFSFAGLTLSDLRKRLLEGTLEAIMWTKWGSPSILFFIVYESSYMFYPPNPV